MKRIGIIPAVTFVLFAFTLSSLTHAKPGGDGNKRLNRMIEELQISDANQDEFISIMKSQHEKKVAIKEQYSSKEEARDAMKSLHQETLSLLGGILSDEQLLKFENMAKKHKKRRKPKDEPATE